MRPLIGITADVLEEPGNERTGGAKYQLNRNYCQAVIHAGGTPVILPPQEDVDTLVSALDGLIIPGGNDINACNWGEENHFTVETVSETRYAFESKLFAGLNARVPVLGICYGCQFVNVQLGGSLIQHVPDVVGHEEHKGGTLQAYRFEPDSKVAQIVGDAEGTGQSWHHQAIGRLGSGLKVVGTHEDGTIEAVESTDRPWLIGVQWHPERTLENPATQRLLTALVEAARAYRASKGG